MVRQRPAPLALDRCMAASHHGHRRKSRIRCVVRVWSARAGRALRVICAHTRVYTEARIAVVLGAADGCDYGYALCCVFGLANAPVLIVPGCPIVLVCRALDSALRRGRPQAYFSQLKVGVMGVRPRPTSSCINNRGCMCCATGGDERHSSCFPGTARARPKHVAKCSYLCCHAGVAQVLCFVSLLHKHGLLDCVFTEVCAPRRASWLHG